MSYTIPTDAYWNPGPVAYPDEPHEPVPGWGMRPNMTGPRLVGVGGLGAAPIRPVPLRGTNGLGYTFSIDTPIGSQSISVPVEKIASDAANLAVNTLKGGLNQAADAAVGVLKSKMPAIADAAVGELQKQTPKIVSTLLPVLQTKVLPPVLQQVTDTAVNKLWPEMQPKVRNEIYVAGAILAAAMVIPLAGVTLYLRREIRKGKT